MAFRRLKALRFLGAFVCAYLIVLQAALGGLAAAGHVSAIEAGSLGVICLNSVASDEDGGDRSSEKLACCVAGCLSGPAVPASTPEVSVFVYDPRPTPRRSLGEREPAPRRDLATALKRPRGPPSIG